MWTFRPKNCLFGASVIPQILYSVRFDSDPRKVQREKEKSVLGSQLHKWYLRINSYKELMGIRIESVCAGSTRIFIFIDLAHEDSVVIR